jgi:hypothetical protein
MSYTAGTWTPEWYANASEESKLEFKSWLSNTLVSQSSVTVKFTKANAEERVMNCTLNTAVINAAYETGSEQPSNDIQELQTGDAFTVWDLDLVNWRCFRLDRLLEITYDQ